MEHESQGIPSDVLRELATLTTLQHPTIIPLLESYIDEDEIITVYPFHRYDVMEYLALMRDLVPSNERMDTICYFMRDLCRALSYCHGRGVLHRNLKPLYCMVSQQGQLKLAGFRLNRIFSIPMHKMTPVVQVLKI
jgi:serine/threonine protein kinase